MPGLTAATDEREDTEEVVTIVPFCVELEDGLYEVHVHLNLSEVAPEDRWSMVRTQCQNLLDMLRTEDSQDEEEERGAEIEQPQPQPPRDEREQDWRQPQDLVQDWTWADRDGDPPRYPPGPPSDWSDNEEDRRPNIPDRDWYDWDSEDHPREE
jgi:hypothetical protein